MQGFIKTSFQAKPLVSIITVVYNGEKYIEKTIQSVLNQTYDNIEYIIIDGG
ncbi:MAG: glycosyltransferase, partial [Sulfurimonadaceae bacterium]